MIVGFRDAWLERFFTEDERSRDIATDIEARLFRRLQMLDDATSTFDLLVPRSNNFEHLQGRLEGLCSLRVNKRWRLVFQWDAERGEAARVYLDDHSDR